MLSYTSRSFLSIVITSALLLAAAPFARAARTAKRLDTPQDKKENKNKKEDKKDDKKDDKKETAKNDDKPKLTKSERKYQEIKRFSIELYNKDADFRDTVDDAYRQKQREHTEFAYDINMRDSSDEQITHDGDKIKVSNTLYDNPLAQDYVNRVGQSVVPSTTTRLYAFKITLNPIPEARALSTGTIYISTGLLSLVDNEAQLAYVLGHEVGHVEKEHWFDDTMVGQGIEPYNEKQAKKRAMWGAVIGAATAGVTGMAGGSSDQMMNNGLLAGLVIAPTLLKFVITNAVSSWDKIQEDEADQLGMKYMLDRNYDPREVPKFFASMQRTSQRDRRVGLGFMGDPSRIIERMAMVNSVINGSNLQPLNLLIGATNLAARQTADTGARTDDGGTGKTLNPTANAAQRAEAAQKTLGAQMSAGLQAKLDAGELIGTTAEFEAVMAELKRDNGVRAFYYDMFQMARDNLEESLRIRSNDPYAHFYYGKVLKLTARNATEKSRALAEFRRAIDLDARRVLPEARLHRALALIENKDPQQMRDIITSLKEYVGMYQREHAGALPPNMDVIYDYMQEAGELSWAASPAMNVSTKNIDPIGVAQGSASRPVSSTPDSSVPHELPAAATQPAADGKPQRGNRRP